MSENLSDVYKPVGLDDIIGQEDINWRLKKYVETGKMGHLMFSGAPGVGKTSCAHALAHDIFGDTKKSNFSVFNASKTRGIDFIRDKIATLCAIQPVSAPFKIIFLDEADALTIDAQEALREIMMAHTKITKFILGCNKPEKIIAPIQDRCRVFRFQKLTIENIMVNILIICKQEGIDYTLEPIEKIAKASNGSMRRAINYLECYIAEGNGNITLDLVSDLKFIEHEDIVKLMVVMKAEKFDEADEIVMKMYYDGMDMRTVLSLIYDRLGDMNALTYNRILRIGEYDWRMSQGSDALLQLRCAIREIPQA